MHFFNKSWDVDWIGGGIGESAAEETGHGGSWIVGGGGGREQEEGVQNDDVLKLYGFCGGMHFFNVFFVKNVGCCDFCCAVFCLNIYCIHKEAQT